MTNLYTKIGLGTVQFGLNYGIANTSGKVKSSEVNNILKSATEVGIDLIDTAAAYGNSEEVIGENSAYPFNVVSKWASSPEITLAKSLGFLKTKHIYGWLAHDIRKIINHPKNWDVMKEQKENGLVKKIGFSIYEPIQLENLLNQNYIPDIIQIPFNFFDRRFEPWLDELKNIGCEIHARSAFLQGLFFVNYNKLDPFFEPIRDWMKEFQFVTRDNVVRASVLLSYVFSFSQIDKVIIGLDNLTQLDDLSKALVSDIEIDFPLLPNIPAEILNPSKWQVNK